MSEHRKRVESIGNDTISSTVALYLDLPTATSLLLTLQNIEPEKIAPSFAEDVDAIVNELRHHVYVERSVVKKPAPGHPQYTPPPRGLRLGSKDGS